MYSLLTYGATRLTESTHKTIFEACHKARAENRPAQVFNRRGALIYSYSPQRCLTRVAKTAPTLLFIATCGAYLGAGLLGGGANAREYLIAINCPDARVQVGAFNAVDRASYAEAWREIRDQIERNDCLPETIATR